jgi:hypothetical protein
MPRPMPDIHETVGGVHQDGAPARAQAAGQQLLRRAGADEVGPGVTAIEIGRIGPDETALHAACGEPVGEPGYGDVASVPRRAG